MKLVITPTGNKTGDSTVLATVSASTRRLAPSNPEAGSKNLLSPPITILHRCGATNPMKPIAPVKLTVIAIMKLLITKGFFWFSRH
jgi:hypothetical protein